MGKKRGKRERKRIKRLRRFEVPITTMHRPIASRAPYFAFTEWGNPERSSSRLALRDAEQNELRAVQLALRELADWLFDVVCYVPSVPDHVRARGRRAHQIVREAIEHVGEKG